MPHHLNQTVVREVVANRGRYRQTIAENRRSSGREWLSPALVDSAGLQPVRVHPVGLQLTGFLVFQRRSDDRLTRSVDMYVRREPLGALRTSG